LYLQSRNSEQVPALLGYLISGLDTILTMVIMPWYSKHLSSSPEKQCSFQYFLLSSEMKRWYGLGRKTVNKGFLLFFTETDIA